METLEQSDRPVTRRLGHDIRWLSVALCVVLVVTMLAGEALAGEVLAAGPLSGLVSDGMNTTNASTLDVGSMILREQDRVILEPTLIGLVGAGLVFVSRRRRSRLSRLSRSG